MEIKFNLIRHRLTLQPLKTRYKAGRARVAITPTILHLFRYKSLPLLLPSRPSHFGSRDKGIRDYVHYQATDQSVSTNLF